MSRTHGRRAAVVLLLCGVLVLDASAAGAAIRPPENLTAIAVASNAIQLSWADNSTDETGYEVRRSLSSTASTFVTIATTTANATGYRDSGLAASTKYFYRVRARRGSAYSSWSSIVNATTPATSSVGPTITGQPLSQVVTAPATASFAVTATGTAPLSYQWQKNGSPIAGATNVGYTTPATSTADSGSTFRVVVSNSVSAVTSSPATLTVNAPGDTTAPTISDVSVTSVSQTGATINWATNEPANGQVEYGQSTAYGQATSVNPSLVTAHSQALGGLTAGTVYHYRIKSRDGANNLATSSDFSFSTASSTAFNPKLVGFVPGIGSPTDVAVSGSSAFISSSTFGLSIADVTNPGAVRLVGASKTSFSGGHVAVGGSRAIVTGLVSGKAHAWVIDTAVPSAPRVVGEVSSTLTGFLEVAMNNAGTRAVIAAGSAGVIVVDLTNPAAPMTATFDTSGMAWAVALNAAGTVAYVADFASGLKVLSLANPAAPTQVGSLPITGNLRDIAVAGTVVYLADQSGRLVTVDVTSASAPQQLGALNTGSWTFQLAVEGNRAVVQTTTGSADQLEVVDISNPAIPVKVGAPLVILGAGQLKGLALRGGRAYVAANSQGLKIYNLTPAFVGGLMDDFVATHIAAAATRAVVTGTYLPTNSARLRVIDTSSPSAPRVVGEVPSAMAPAAFLEVALNDAGTRAVVATGTAGVIVVNLTNPAAPTTATFDTAGTAFAVAINAAGTVAYVADGSSGLKVLSLANPAAPTQVGSLAVGGIPREISVAGSVVYLADQMGRLVTVDVTTPNAPQKLGEFVTGRYTFHVGVEGTRAVVLASDSADWLYVFDVSDPAHPVLVGTPLAITAGGESKAVALTGGRAYIAANTGGLRIYGVTGSTPSPLGSGFTVGAALDVSVAASKAFVADGTSTISVIDLFAP